jgi:c-di-AMP phosphodiesterase-like protein
LSNNFVTKSRIMFVYDRSNIDNEFNNSLYLSRVVMNLLQIWQFRMYCFTFRIISDQRWFLLSSLIVLFISEWSNANWSCISCINESRFDSSIMINSTAYRELNCSKRSKVNKIWFCCFWQSFLLKDRKVKRCCDKLR